MDKLNFVELKRKAHSCFNVNMQVVISPEDERCLITFRTIQDQICIISDLHFDNPADKMIIKELKMLKHKNKKRCDDEKKKIGDLTLKEAEELKNCCGHIGFINGECYVDCVFFDEKKCECKLSSLARLREIDLNQEIEVEE